MARRRTPVPKRRPFPDIDDDFALDELTYDQDEIDPPYPKGPLTSEEDGGEAWLPQYTEPDQGPPGPLDYPEP